MTKKKSILLFLLLFALSTQINLAQVTDPISTEEQKAKIGLLAGVSSYPVIYGTKQDNLPRKMKVRGVIEEVTFVPMACGVICWSGTAKIKLLNKIKGYEPEYAYLTVLCLFGKAEDFLNKIVEVKVTKLEKGKTWGCEGIVNGIDSNGVAFYKLDKNQSIQ
jgi:hypothetical protein